MPASYADSNGWAHWIAHGLALGLLDNITPYGAHLRNAKGGLSFSVVDDSDQAYYYLNDHLGTPRVVFKESNPSSRDAYSVTSSFGVTIDEAVTTTNEYKYTGKPKRSAFICGGVANTRVPATLVAVPSSKHRHKV